MSILNEDIDNAIHIRLRDLDSQGEPDIATDRYDGDIASAVANMPIELIINPDRDAICCYLSRVCPFYFDQLTIFKDIRHSQFDITMSYVYQAAYETITRTCVSCCIDIKSNKFASDVVEAIITNWSRLPGVKDESTKESDSWILPAIKLIKKWES